MDYTKSDVTCNVGYVTMRDRTRIAYVSYHPNVGLHSTVLLYNCYTASAMPFEQAKPLLDAGYSVVGANWPATGCSEGVVDDWLPDRLVGACGAEIVEWIAEQPWSDGNVGMIGYSYSGASQVWVAAERPPHLRAIIPAGLADNYETCFYLGGMQQAGPAAFDRHLKNTHSIGMEWRISQGDTECTKIRGSARQVCKNGYSEAHRQHQFKDAWWHSKDLARPEVAGRINVPTMIIGAYHDENGGVALECARIFSRLTPDLKNKRLVLTNGDHASHDFVEGYPFIRAEQLRFLDRWVKGIENGIDNEPPVKVFWEAVSPGGDVTNAVAGWSTFHVSWPDPMIQRQSFFLGADGTLSTDHPTSTRNRGIRSYLYPTGFEVPLNAGGGSGMSPDPGAVDRQFAILPFEQGVLNYRTAPAAEDTTLLGNPEVVLFVSIDAGDDADIVVTLKDVGPDGTVLFLQSGQHRASFQEIDEAQTNSEEVLHTFTKREKLRPNEIYEVRMSMFNPFAHVLRKGHSLEFTISAPNPIPHDLIGSIPAGCISVNRVYQTEAHSSKIILPILPGAAAHTSMKANGKLLNQPVRKQHKFVAGGLEPLEHVL
ncbi:MAG: CocE/NonD family hydrolase [Mesorhizobium sp.]|nr:CocE/NonD family hydrolase [Mesorhizobium sp.]TIN74237.1 MAG: CocE/NonD family hydrolase [Mesorhizobium sp.]TIO64038.1 MAG: CocE/NonD family hydrolase [Mesorhizobium sp.]TJV88172.1 MAG: CocE/NonD family hydrolase [Mesorhizobium sp.]